MSEDIDADVIDNSDGEFSTAAMGGAGESPAEPVEPARDDSDDGDEFEASVTDATGIDWGALWDEYHFAEPDVDGSVVISGTQLEAAIEASEQDIGGTARQHIADAVDNGDLVAKTTSCGTKMGYIWEGML